MRQFILLVIFCGGLFTSFSQDVVYAKKIVDTLTSEAFWGRGYTKDGMAKAANFIAGKYEEYGLKPMQAGSYFQNFSFPVNTFPGKMKVAINGHQLRPGEDFIIAPASRGKRVSCKLVQVDSNRFATRNNKVAVVVKEKLTWSVKQLQDESTIIIINKKALKSQPTSIAVNVDARYLSSFKAANVCGVVPGTKNPDSIIVFTAHYDHLGGMGNATYFPGANDNASGVSLLLSLAKYYAAHPQPYTIAFICFAAEEAGLVGSEYFINNPLIPINHIRFLTNVDLVGTGIDGITVVNATAFPQAFATLNAINAKANFLPFIRARGKAANSDHYWFTEKGVPSFFIYTQGGIAAYHDIYDVSKTLPFTAFENLFKLLVKFTDDLIKPKVVPLHGM